MAEPDDEVQQTFRDLPYRLKRELAEEVRDTAEWLAAQVEEAAPEGETGNTRSSVRVERGRNTLEFIVKAGGALTTKPVRKGTTTEYDYALGGEFGTQHQSADPWFYPTCRANINEANERLAQAAAGVVGDTGEGRSLFAQIARDEIKGSIRRTLLGRVKRIVGTRTVDAAQILLAVHKGPAALANFAVGKAVGHTRRHLANLAVGHTRRRIKRL